MHEYLFLQQMLKVNFKQSMVEFEEMIYYSIRIKLSNPFYRQNQLNDLVSLSGDPFSDRFLVVTKNIIYGAISFIILNK